MPLKLKSAQCIKIDTKNSKYNTNLDCGVNLDSLRFVILGDVAVSNLGRIRTARLVGDSKYVYCEMYTNAYNVQTST